MTRDVSTLVIIATYKASPAVAHDNSAPRALQRLSRELAALMTPYRIWARRAAEAAFTWMLGLNSEGITNGPGMASEDAAYQIALEAEGASVDINDVNITLIDDPEKGSEMVRHGVLREKALWNVFLDVSQPLPHPCTLVLNE